MHFDSNPFLHKTDLKQNTLKTSLQKYGKSLLKKRLLKTVETLKKKEKLLIKNIFKRPHTPVHLKNLSIRWKD